MRILEVLQAHRSFVISASTCAVSMMARFRIENTARTLPGRCRAPSQEQSQRARACRPQQRPENQTRMPQCVILQQVAVARHSTVVFRNESPSAAAAAAATAAAVSIAATLGGTWGGTKGRCSNRSHEPTNVHIYPPWYMYPPCTGTLIYM